MLSRLPNDVSRCGMKVRVPTRSAAVSVQAVRSMNYGRELAGCSSHTRRVLKVRAAEFYARSRSVNTVNLAVASVESYCKGYSSSSGISSFSRCNQTSSPPHIEELRGGLEVWLQRLNDEIPDEEE